MRNYANVRALWATKWSHPFGGGEAAFYQCMRWAIEMGMEVVWISFYTSRNEPYDSFEYERTEFGGHILHVPGGFDPLSFEAWLILLRPSFVHQQGSLKYEMLQVCKRSNIPMISAFHFWSECILLSPSKQHIDILENCREHTKDPKFDDIVENSSTVYVASDFMREVIRTITTYDIGHTVYPSPDPRDCIVTSDQDPFDRPYVTMINIHVLKGGEFFLRMIQSAKDISFHAVQTEHCSESLDGRIEEAIRSRNASSEGAKCKYSTRVSDVRKIYAECKIVVLGSLVDETFCRVAVEAMANGIPIVTTGKGNIRRIVGDAAVRVSECDGSNWSDAVRILCCNRDIYDVYRRKALQRYPMFDVEISKAQFTEVLRSSFDRERSKAMVMFFTPWCDQGLGIQCRSYVTLLESGKVSTCIFAFHPYWSSEGSNRNQWDTNEWYHPRIHYSESNREQVTDREIVDFVRRFQVTHCVIPETCWFRVFEVARLLDRLRVKCFAIPNIEIVRKDELWKHHYFYKILCNNRSCRDQFSRYGFSNLEYLGYAIESKVRDDVSVREAEEDGEITFLFLGGLNAFSRKQVHQVLQSFTDAVERRKGNESLPGASTDRVRAEV